jgi:hypothetical protein
VGAFVNIVGLSDVQQMLREAPTDIVALGFIRALQAGGNVIANQVEVRTPVKKEDTGGLLDKAELRESLMIAFSLDSKLKWGAAQIGFGKNGHVALWVEYGHKMLGHRPGKKSLTLPVRPHPFMRPAADAAADPAIAAVAASLSDTVRTYFPQGKP